MLHFLQKEYVIQKFAFFVISPAFISYQPCFELEFEYEHRHESPYTAYCHTDLPAFQYVQSSVVSVKPLLPCFNKKKSELCKQHWQPMHHMSK